MWDYLSQFIEWRLLALYLKEAKQLKGSVIFAGRLGDYKYYNMDQAVTRALGLFEKEIAGKTVTLPTPPNRLALHNKA